MKHYLKHILLFLLTIAFVSALLTVGIVVFLGFLLLLPIIIWWFKRKMRHVEEAFMQATQDAQEAPEVGGAIIEVDYKVVDDE